MKLKELKKRIGQNFKSNWFIIWSIIVILLGSNFMNIGLEHIPYKSMHSVYVGQEMRIYEKINKNEIYIPGSLYISDKTDEYVSIIATEIGEYNINLSGGRGFCTIDVKEGNDYDSYVILTNNSWINSIKNSLIFIGIFLIIGIVWIIPIIIIDNRKKQKAI